MKRIVIIATVLIALAGIFTFLSLSLHNRPDILPTELKGKVLPQFSAQKLDAPNTTAMILTQNDIKGPALINVWATWCPTCEAEHTMLNTLKKQNITIYGINYKDDPIAANQWLERLGNPYIFNLSDVEGIVGIEMGVYGAPETFFLDHNNIIRYRHVGAITQENWDGELKAIYESLLTQQEASNHEKN